MFLIVDSVHVAPLESWIHDIVNTQSAYASDSFVSSAYQSEMATSGRVINLIHCAKWLRCRWVLSPSEKKLVFRLWKGSLSTTMPKTVGLTKGELWRWAAGILSPGSRCLGIWRSWWSWSRVWFLALWRIARRTGTSTTASESVSSRMGGKRPFKSTSKRLSNDMHLAKHIIL